MKAQPGDQRKCKACGRMLRFVAGENGKLIPLDLATPVFEITKDLTGLEVAKRAGGQLFVSHFSTCPEANQFSGGKKR